MEAYYQIVLLDGTDHQNKKVDKPSKQKYRLNINIRFEQLVRVLKKYIYHSYF